MFMGRCLNMHLSVSVISGYRWIWKPMMNTGTERCMFKHLPINITIALMLEHAPFCERDFRLPVDLETHDEHGDFEVKIKKRGLLYPYIYGTHPFDVIGWDGYNYPYAFSIFNFEPITGRIHMP